MTIIASSVADTLLDETGVIRSDANSKSSSGWSTFRDKFASKGEIANVPPPFMSIGDIPWGRGPDLGLNM